MNAPPDAFRAMADRIEHNKDAQFGGAFVIVPPGDNAKPITAFVVNGDGSEPNTAQFFMLLQAEIKFRLDQIELEERQQAAFGRR